MRDRKSNSFNPLVLDPEDYEPLLDEDYPGFDQLEEGDPEFEFLSNGSRRRKPQINPDF